MNTFHNCTNCAIYQNAQCRANIIPHPTKTTKCDQWTDQLYTCQFCGRPVKDPILAYKDPEDKEPVISCAKCAENLSSCFTCANKDKCAFDELNYIHKFITKTMRTGIGMQMQVQVPNPEVIQFTCIDKNCPCLSEDHTQCNKHAIGTCAKNCWAKQIN